jgi:hypothetical protein
MKLRNGKVFDAHLDSLKTNYWYIYQKIKSRHTFNNLYKYAEQNHTNKMIEICNLYFSVIIYTYNLYNNKTEFLELFKENKLINFEKNIPDTECCYICRSNSFSDVFATKCSNNHPIHLECFYYKIIQPAKETDKDFMFHIDKTFINCDYCSARIA